MRVGVEMTRLRLITRRDRRDNQLVGGTQEIEAILRTVQQGKCCTFIGARYQDKSLLMRAARRAVVEQLDYFGLYISLWDIHTSSQTKFLRAFCDLVIEDAHQSFDLSFPRTSIHTSADLERFLERLPAYARRNTVLFVDDLEREAVPPACISELLRVLRAVYETRMDGWRFLAVVCASNSLAHTALGPTSPFENISELVSIGTLNRTETAERVTQLLRAHSMQPTSDALEYIFEQTRGDRYLVRQISTQCCCQIGQRKRVTRAVVHRAIEQWLHSVTAGPLAESLRELESNLRLLQATLDLLQGKPISVRFSFRRNEPDPLETLGFVVWQTEGYRIKSPLHRRWLERALTPERLAQIFLRAGEWTRAIDFLQEARGDDWERRSRIMTAAVSAMYSMPTYHDALKQLMYGLERAYPHQTFLLYELDQARDELRLCACSDQVSAASRTVPRLDDLQTPHEYWWEMTGSQSITLFVPVRTTQGKTLGLLRVENLVTRKDFRRQQHHILELIGYLRHAANALENRIEFQQLQQQTQRHASDLEHLHSVIEQLMRASDSFQEVLTHVLASALKAFQEHAHVGSIWIYHPDEGVLRMDAQHGLPKNIHVPPLRPGEGIAGQVYVEGVLRNVPDAFQEKQFVDLGTEFKPRSMIAVPLIGRSSTLGVLCLDNLEQTAAFDQGDEQLLRIFAGQVALWLETVRAADTLHQKRDLARLATKLVHQLAGIINAAPEVLDEIRAKTKEEAMTKLIEELQRKVSAVSQIGRWVDRYIRLDQMSLDTVDPVELLRRVYARARESQSAQIIIHEPVVSGALPPLRADQLLIEVLIENLIQNAIDALSQTRSPGEIHSRIELQNGFCVIQIWDNGPGIPVEHRARIWEAGYTTKPRQGIESGLGLHLCRHIVQAHHGTIEYTDAPTGGACFTIRLPLAGPQMIFGGSYVSSQGTTYPPR